MFRKQLPLSFRLLEVIWHNQKHKNIHIMLTRIKAPYSKNKEYCLWTGLFFIWPGGDKKDDEAIDKKAVILNSILEIADKVFERGKYEECYDLLTNCENQDDIEIKWRISRTLYNMSRDLKYKKNYKKALIRQAHDIIATEVEGHCNHFAVHKWFALTLDAKSSNEGLKQRIQQLENVKKHMDIAVSLNPTDASLLHMLGEWCYQLTDLPWHQRRTAETLYAALPKSTYQDALEYFLRAEEVQPRFYSVNLLRLGCCYLKLNMEDQAKYYLKLAASYPAKSNDDHRANKEAAEILTKMK